MGDEELNFTEEEAQCWADDPRNQAQNSGAMAAVLLACILFLIALVTIALVNNSGSSTSHGSETQAGVPLVQ